MGINGRRGNVAYCIYSSSLAQPLYFIDGLACMQIGISPIDVYTCSTTYEGRVLCWNLTILWIMNVHTKPTVMFKYHSWVNVCVEMRSKKLFKLYEYGI